jgi:hypothetical protein
MTTTFVANGPVTKVIDGSRVEEWIYEFAPCPPCLLSSKKGTSYFRVSHVCAHARMKGDPAPTVSVAGIEIHEVRHRLGRGEARRRYTYEAVLPAGLIFASGSWAFCRAVVDAYHAKYTPQPQAPPVTEPATSQAPSATEARQRADDERLAQWPAGSPQVH